MPDDAPLSPAFSDNNNGALERVPAGTRFGIWLLWLCFGLSSSALLFLGVPIVLAFFAVRMLERADVPLEVWSELEPWVALLLLTVAVNGYASFTHRRALAATLRPSDDKAVETRWWLVLGGVAYAAWLGLLRLEHIPRTQLNPVLHYWALSGVIVWTSLSLARLTGRVVSLVIAPIERYSLHSGAMRGSLSTAGPLSLVAIVAVGGATFGVDLDDTVDDTRDLLEGSFKDEWSIKALGPAGGGSSTSTSTPTRRKPSDWFNSCIEQIYGGRPSLYEGAVRRISSYTRIDAESVAADAAIKVCSRPEAPSDLGSYYAGAVRNGANSEYSRSRRFDECAYPITEPYRTPSGETPYDCVRQQLCRLGVDDQDVLVHFFMGETAPELATRMLISSDAAEKRVTRAKRRLQIAARSECFD